MKARRALALALATTLMWGCATTRAPEMSSLERRVRQLEDSLYALQRANEELRRRVENSAGPTLIAPPTVGAAVRAEPESPRVESPRTRVDDVVPVSTGDGDRDWNRAKEEFDRTRYQTSIGLLRNFVRDHPRHQRVVEGQFLIGEAYYAEANFAQAIVEFGRVVEQRPKDARAPDALYKMALSYYEIGYAGNAKEHLERLRRDYPDSAAAKSSKSLLERLR